MAVTKIKSVTYGVKTVSNYIANPEKTVIPKEQLEELHVANSNSKETVCMVRGINCSPEYVAEQFSIIKTQYGKTDGIVAYHGCISFPPNTLTPKQTIDIATEFVSTVWGEDFQCLIACHNNTQCLHCHFLINSVSFEGFKLHDNKTWFQIYKVADDICRKYEQKYLLDKDITSIVSDEPVRRIGRSKLSVKGRAAYDILQRALSKATSYSELLQRMDEEPCEYNFSLASEDWYIIPEGYVNPFYLEHLRNSHFKKEYIIDLYDDIELDEYYTQVSYPVQFDEKPNSELMHSLQVIGRDLFSNKAFFPNKLFYLTKDNAEVLSLVIYCLDYLKEKNFTSESQILERKETLRDALITLNRVYEENLSQHSHESVLSVLKGRIEDVEKEGRTISLIKETNDFVKTMEIKKKNMPKKEVRKEGSASAMVNTIKRRYI